ncbi:hypothetical protein KKC60_01805 [Patescibacteria group bacterium]|nr:hypothetical protein [Patescibacteria group bacterium]
MKKEGKVGLATFLIVAVLGTGWGYVAPEEWRKELPRKISKFFGVELFSKFRRESYRVVSFNNYRSSSTGSSPDNPCQGPLENVHVTFYFVRTYRGERGRGMRLVKIYNERGRRLLLKIRIPYRYRINGTIDLRLRGHNYKIGFIRRARGYDVWKKSPCDLGSHGKCLTPFKSAARGRDVRGSHVYLPFMKGLYGHNGLLKVEDTGGAFHGRGRRVDIFVGRPSGEKRVRALIGQWHRRRGIRVRSSRLSGEKGALIVKGCVLQRN